MLHAVVDWGRKPTGPPGYGDGLGARGCLDQLVEDAVELLGAEPKLVHHCLVALSECVEL